jgi:hypothetical protein
MPGNDAMHIIELLQLRHLDMNARIKMVRHQDQRYDLYTLMTSGHIETYQACQSSTIFECDYVVSFFGLPRSKARFLGVYRVNGRSKVANIHLPMEYPIQESPNKYFYHLSKVSGFEDFEERIIIDWGGSTRSWHQWLSEKEVVEILPRGYTRPFPGYLDFILDQQELVRIMQYPEANREWHTNLSAVAGVYLIVQESTGAQYVGSAYGPQGILGRWKNYAINGHGDNIRLRELVAAQPGIYREFRYSILRTLPKSLTAQEVIGFETFYKDKLGTRAHGLNAN